MIFYLTKHISGKQHQILGYFESLNDLEKALNEDEELAKELSGNGKIYKMKPGFMPERELVREL